MFPSPFITNTAHSCNPFHLLFRDVLEPLSLALERPEGTSGVEADLAVLPHCLLVSLPSRSSLTCTETLVHMESQGSLTRQRGPHTALERATGSTQQESRHCAKGFFRFPDWPSQQHAKRTSSPEWDAERNKDQLMGSWALESSGSLKSSDRPSCCYREKWRPSEGEDWPKVAQEVKMTMGSRWARHLSHQTLSITT